MQSQRVFSNKALLNFGGYIYRYVNPVAVGNPNFLQGESRFKPRYLKETIPWIFKCADMNPMKINRMNRTTEIKCLVNNSLDELSEEDDDLCPVECVKEFKTDDEFSRILEKAKETNSLVIVDFYRTSCGSCKYIEQGFAKLCKGAGDQEAAVIFLKHNVYDEYDEPSEVSERLRIKAVPLFHFYKNGVLVEAFPTRDKERIFAAILKYSTASQD